MLDRLLGSTLIILSLFLCLLFLGEVQPPKINKAPLSISQIKQTARFYDKSDYGVHHVFLSGSDFERGQQYGYLTKTLLKEQEDILQKKLDEIFPSSIFQSLLVLFAKGWFQGLDGFFQENWKKEMYGVSLYAPQERLFWTSIYTRQFAYHGLHEMGQMLIDSGFVLGACSQLAVPLRSGWLIGRNFDFDAGRIFDEDKILKWTFPEEGYPFVSVTFAGMVGVITGINSQGVYIAINAAGSDDLVRVGMPSTLVVLKALQHAKTAEEAERIIQQERTLISDIFVIADRGSALYVVEKSPTKSFTRKETSAQSVTNHFISDFWKNDKKNQSRVENLTTLQRQQRGSQLVTHLTEKASAETMLKALRDKEVDGKIVPGHRGTIDALIASHSLIYDSQKAQLFVSSSPSLTNKFYGFDLKESFKQRKPIASIILPQDSQVLPEEHGRIKRGLKLLANSLKLTLKGHCDEAIKLLNTVDPRNFANHYLFDWASAEVAACQGEQDKALSLWQTALKKNPAYKREKLKIEERIRHGKKSL